MMLKIGIFCFVFVIISSCAGSTQTGKDYQNVVTFNSGSKTMRQGDDAWCEMCVLIMNRVKVLIKEKDNEGKVNSTLFNLCDIMKGVMRKQCYEMVPLIKAQLTSGFDSHQACLMLQFCGGGNASSVVMKVVSKMNDDSMDLWSDLSPILNAVQPYVTKLVQDYSLLKAKAGGSLTCMMCKTAVDVIDKSLQHYKKPLTDYIIGICNDLPAPTNKACSDAMAFYIPTWWDAFFTNIAAAKEVCYQLGMCKEPIVRTPPKTTHNT